MTQIQAEIQLFRAYLHAMRTTLLAMRDDRGAVTAEQVIWTAVLAGGAITIGGVLIAKFTGAANSIPTGP